MAKIAGASMAKIDAASSCKMRCAFTHTSFAAFLSVASSAQA
jgi:hypothetical protein